MTNWLLAGIIGFYIGVMMGFHPIIALGGAMCATLARVVFFMLTLDDDYDGR